jgi:protein required for attachment to host cells
MSRIRIPSRSWIVVCDGAKALFFQNIGDAQALSLKAVEVRLEPHPPTRDLGSDRPGRSFSAKSGSPSAVENTNWHDAAEADFLRGLAFKLDGLVLTQGVANLFIVAPPKALGILRQHLTPTVRQVLSAEIPKDFVKLPTIEIERRLSAMA